MKHTTRFARSMMAMLLVVAMLATVCVSAFAAESIYFARYEGSSGSIVTALNAINVDSSYSFRCKIAEANNITGYRGTAAQNTQMLNLLKAGKLVKPGHAVATAKPSTTTTQPTTPADTHTTTVYNTSGYMMVSASSAKLRTSASAIGSVYARPAKGTLLSVNGTLNNYAGQWYKVKINGTQLYVLQSQLTKAGAQTTATLVRVQKDAVLRNAPYETGAVVKNLQAGQILHTVGTFTNKYNNLWYVVKLQNQNTLYFIYSGNVSKTYSNSGSLYLDAAAYFQTTGYTCSAASALAVIRYYNTGLDVKDTALYESTAGYVYKTKDAINNQLGTATYKYATFKSTSAYEQAVRASLAQGSPVIARIKFSKGYFNYNSGGHYTTIIGIYTDKSGTTWLKVADSFVNNFSSNSYSDPSTGIVYVPLATMYQYGTYNGTSDVYLIYND